MLSKWSRGQSIQAVVNIAFQNQIIGGRAGADAGISAAEPRTTLSSGLASLTQLRFYSATKGTYQIIYALGIKRFDQFVVVKK